MKTFFDNWCHRNALVGRTLSSNMLLDLRIIIFHQIASRGRMSSSRDISDIYTRFGIFLLAVGSILEGVSKLIEKSLAVSLVG